MACGFQHRGGSVWWPGCVALLAAACAGRPMSGDSTKASNADASGTNTTSDGTDTSASPPADSGFEIPVTPFYSVSASFEVVGGAWVPDAATLSAELWSAEVEAVCGLAVPILDAVPEAPPQVGEDDVPLDGWWRLTLDAGIPDAPCADWPARVSWIGVGPYDARLDPAMNARGMLGFDVFGLYLRESQSGPVFVVGIAGTEEMLTGAQDLVGYGLIDGVYQAQSLVLMPFE